ncbi:uncharacterized protein EHS24_006896 [Apiotrichum porosum]|uniref:Uncharacterized protein n=1 Tax=Apiotrichum porosum TaxID=105984 RepID=A0A427XWI4_9TREE|nr:uncharacterized protein EHS24_006896 [Apiotrichum porosum]RSH83229.1 hypothetical protein EHS24_006896 [Apiotrichum porosum]
MTVTNFQAPADEFSFLSCCISADQITDPKYTKTDDSKSLKTFSTISSGLTRVATSMSGTSVSAKTKST